MNLISLKLEVKYIKIKMGYKINLQRGRDSNPRYAFGVYTLSRRAPSTTRPPLSILLQTQCQETKKTLITQK